MEKTYLILRSKIKIKVIKIKKFLIEVAEDGLKKIKQNFNKKKITILIKLIQGCQIILKTIIKRL